MSIQDTDIQTYASDILEIAELVVDALKAKFRDEDDAENITFEDAAMEKELDDIANRLWKIKTKLEAE